MGFDGFVNVIPSTRTIVYGLDDEITGNLGKELRVTEDVTTAYEALIDSYVKTLELPKHMKETKDLLTNASGDEFGRLTTEYKQLEAQKSLIELAREKTLNFSLRAWAYREGYGIEVIKIKKTGDHPIYFKDIFDTNSGAEIVDIVQTAEVTGRGPHIGPDGYETRIKNDRAGIECVLEW